MILSPLRKATFNFSDMKVCALQLVCPSKLRLRVGGCCTKASELAFIREATSQVRLWTSNQRSLSEAKYPLGGRERSWRPTRKAEKWWFERPSLKRRGGADLSYFSRACLSLRRATCQFVLKVWLLLLFQASSLYWSQHNFKMNKYELCHLIALPRGDSFRIIDILNWLIQCSEPSCIVSNYHKLCKFV